MESDYRDFWEFPYTERGEDQPDGVPPPGRGPSSGGSGTCGRPGSCPSRFELITRPESQAVLDTIGGVKGEGLVAARGRGREPHLQGDHGTRRRPTSRPSPHEVGGPYKPFDHIERIRVPAVHGAAGGTRDLMPLAIFDDAHVLHPEQFRALEHFLVRRELRIARWIIARFDVLLPEEALAAAIEDRSDATEYPGVTAGPRHRADPAAEFRAAAESSGSGSARSRRTWRPATSGGCRC